jgi:hypothetical protein
MILLASGPETLGAGVTDAPPERPEEDCAVKEQHTSNKPAASRRGARRVRGCFMPRDSAIRVPGPR